MSIVDDVLRGHRIHTHTADVVVEAWGEHLGACLEEAVAGLVDAFVDRADPPTTDTVAVSIDFASPEDLLVSLLEEVIDLIKVLGVVPVHTSLGLTEDGGVSGTFDVAGLRSVELSGAYPKSVTLAGLDVHETRGTWSCQVIVDF